MKPHVFAFAFMVGTLLSGACNQASASPEAPKSEPTPFVDSDGDGTSDTTDNCPCAVNPDQNDLDNDGKGDRCDTDLDGDGVPNSRDNSPEVPNAGQEDLDGDGVGDVSDRDIDGDGISNINDAFPRDPRLESVIRAELAAKANARESTVKPKAGTTLGGQLRQSTKTPSRRDDRLSSSSTPSGSDSALPMPVRVIMALAMSKR